MKRAPRRAPATRTRPKRRVPVVFTIGHSTRTIAEFIALLRLHGVEHLVDVRTVPRSRHNPQFNGERLAESLANAGIEYTPLAALGGRRHPKRESTNTGWRNASFRGYADYMQTPEFAQAIGQLVELSGKGQVAIMCAEAVPWRCHRSLIADALLVRGIPVEDIIAGPRRRPHQLTPFATVDSHQITYPAP